jgi:ubiquinone/menaquinone biosynthesis C-methylase UbiE
MTTLSSNEPQTRADAATFDNGRRGRFNAWFFTAFDGYVNHVARRHKRHAFADMSPGTIVEIGAGVGANFDHLPAGSRVVAIEPNLAMHGGLLRRAAERDVALELVATDAGRLPLVDDSADDVMCSLVLCTVADPEAVLAEIRRVLRPGGRFRFVEHVAAPAWSPRHWLQHAIRRPWSWIYEGCDLCRDTASTIERAGFTDVDVSRRRFRHSCFVPVNTAIHGIATN